MNLPPAIHEALAHAMPQPSRQEAYIQALKSFMMPLNPAGQHDAWKRAMEELAFLRREQRIVDPDGALWRQHGDEAFLRMDK